MSPGEGGIYWAKGAADQQDGRRYIYVPGHTKEVVKTSSLADEAYTHTLSSGSCRQVIFPSEGTDVLLGEMSNWEESLGEVE